MKKVLFATLIAISLISSAFAGPAKKVTYFVKSAFETAFPNATEVEWKVTADYTKASFVRDDVRNEAFYDPQGNFIGKSHAISLEKLPTTIKSSFAKKYGSYTVSEAIQFEGVEETAYFISAENEKQSVVLKVANGDISFFKVTEK